MKRFICFLTILLLLLTPSSLPITMHSPALLPDVSGLALYRTFMNDLESGIVTRTNVNLDSWYHFVSSTREKIHFAPDASGRKQMTYQIREPFVFWYYPAPGYFDGTDYYYRHNDIWFLDKYNRFTDYRQEDFMGIPSYILTTYPVAHDEVYAQFNEYFTYITLESPDGQTSYHISGVLDQKQNFKQINITISNKLPDGDVNYTHYYRITYEQVNEPLTIQPPKDFDADKVPRVAL